MRSLYKFILDECEGAMAGPGDTMGMGNPMAPTDSLPGSEPIVTAKAKKEKKKKSAKA